MYVLLEHVVGEKPLRRSQMSRKVYPLRYFVLARIVCIYFMFCDFIVANLSTLVKFA